VPEEKDGIPYILRTEELDIEAILLIENRILV